MSQPDTPEQPDTESQKTAVPQPEMQPETSSETPSEPQEPAQWQPEKHRFSSIGILAASAIGVVLALYAFRLPPFGMGESLHQQRLCARQRNRRQPARGRLCAESAGARF